MVKCMIEANSDVTGTGIRASIYALCLASGIFKVVIKHSTDSSSAADFSRSINAALQIQGLALLCTAIYQTFRTKLTLFHAICVLHLLSLLGFGLVAKGRYGEKRRNRRLALWAFKLIAASAFLAFAAYIWATAPKFGSQPDCNSSTIYVVFGANIDATQPVFRYAVLALMCALVLGILWSTLIFGLIVTCICGSKRNEKLVRSDDVAMAGRILGRIQFKDDRAKRAMQNGEIGAVLLRTGINIYAIVTLEQTIRRNNVSDGEKDWGFGQVLAVFLLLGPLAEVVNIFLARMDKREIEREENMDDGDHESVRPVRGNQTRFLMPGLRLQENPSSSRV